MTARVFVYIVYAFIAAGLIYVIGTPFFETGAKQTTRILDDIEQHRGGQQ